MKPTLKYLTDEELVHDDVDTDLTASEEDGRITLGDVTPRPFPTIVTHVRTNHFIKPFFYSFHFIPLHTEHI